MYGGNEELKGPPPSFANIKRRSEIYFSCKAFCHSVENEWVYKCVRTEIAEPVINISGAYAVIGNEFKL